MADIREVAVYLGILPEKPYIWKLVDRLEHGVATPFVEAYAPGLAPGPYVRYNQVFRFDYIVERMPREGLDYVATGHYACLDHISNGSRLQHGASLEKDQGYVLAGVRTEMFAHAIFPLFDVCDKAETHSKAQRRGSSVAHKRDNFDIYFIRDDDTCGSSCGKLSGARLGVIVDEDGTAVDQHLGAFLYAVGQYRGLHLLHPHEDS